MKNRPTRRTFLRGAGVAMGLPMLESMLPRTAATAVAAAVDPRKAPHRMVCVCTALGIEPQHLFPQQSGRGYRLSPYLQVLEKFRDDFTVFSGVSHPDVDGGHSALNSYLTAAPHPGSSSFRNSISLDQFAAEKIGSETRFASLALCTNGGSLSVTRNGTPIPAERRPSAMFSKLFLTGSPKEVRQQVQRLKDGQSIMDTVSEQTRRLQGQVGTRDRQRLDEYFTSVREVEQRLTRAEEWSKKPKPKVNVPPPQDIAEKTDLIGKTKLMYDLVHLAFQTDSTRVITLSVDPAGGVPPVKGVTMDHHNLSHHGKDPEKLAQLWAIETEQMRQLAGLLQKLKQTQEQDQTLLDRTMVLYGSNLGNSSSHSTKNMPMILAGGGFRHGQHLVFDLENNTPLCKVYVSMLQRMGIETETFATGKGTISGLEAA